MRLLFLAYANSQQDPLHTLQEEDDRVYKTLSRRMAQQHVRLHRDSYSTIPKVLEYLTLFQEDIALFYFAGHAGRDRLLLADEEANALGIAAALGRCPHLKLVVLNGCSTKGQVQALLNAGVRVVIATSAPVNDRSATQFAITFFEAMADKLRSVREAFADALAAAQTVNPQTLETDLNRGILTDDAHPEHTPLWGLYCQENSDLDWTLPLAASAPPEYIPNEQLIDALLNALAPYNREVQTLLEDEEQGLERGAGEKKKAILACLPHPVSQQLRKLMSRERGIGEDHVFYDKPGLDRLRQIAHTYSTMVELLAFILLADLWKASETASPALRPLADQSTLLGFLTSRENRQNPFDFIRVIRPIRLAMEQANLPFFVEEYPSISRQFNEDTPLAAACRFLEALRQRSASKGGLSEPEASLLCPAAEDKLATVCAQLGFMARYSLSSVRHIQVLKYRFPATPRFDHKVIRLAQEFVQLDEINEIMDDYMDASSVLLQRKNGDPRTFLNLSPFVIDESAFDAKADLAKIFFFERYDKSSNAQYYRHVYKPDDPPLIVKEQKYFKGLRAQFDAFSRSLFHKTLQEL